MEKGTKENLKFWGAMSIGAAVPGSVAAFMGAPWWAIAIATVSAPLLLVVLFFMLVINEISKGI